MAGEAKTTAFFMGSASIMIGPKDGVFSLNEAAHSIGLAKNWKISSEPSYTELTQGVKNQIVDSVMTKNDTKISGEAYEYTVKNLMYALGLDGSSLTSTGNAYAPNADIAPAATTAIIAGDVTSTFGAGDWIEIVQGNDSHIAKLTSATVSTNTTLTFTGFAIPTGLTFAAATTKIRKVKRVDVGSNVDQPYLSAKIVFDTTQDGLKTTLLLPKVRITKGFDLASKTDAYGNMPFELTPYQITSSDADYAKLVSGGIGIANGYLFKGVV